MHDLPRVSLRHVGIFVTDFDLMVDFYCRLFGFQVSDRSDGHQGRKVAFLSNDPNAHHTLVISSGREPGFSTGRPIHRPAFAAL